MLGRLTLNPLSHIDWFGTVLFPLLLVFSGLPAFGWAKPVPVNPQNLAHPRRDFAVVAIAGPVSNVILAVAASLLVPLVPEGPTGAIVWNVLAATAVINVMLAVFNMLPIPPLDGGNGLAGFVPEPVARMIDALRPYGVGSLIALLYLGVIRAITGPVVSMVLSWLQ